MQEAVLYVVLAASLAGIVLSAIVTRTILMQKAELLTLKAALSPQSGLTIFSLIEALPTQFDRSVQPIKADIVQAEMSIQIALREQATSGLQAALPVVEKNADSLNANLAAFRTETTSRLDAFSQSAIAATEQTNMTIAAMVSQIAALKLDSVESLSKMKEALSTKLGAELGTFKDSVSRTLKEYNDSGRQEQETLRGLVGQRLEAIRADNEARLQSIQGTVEQKLSESLEKHLKTSFESVAAQFAKVQQDIGQVHAAAAEIGDVKRLFSGVKVRGGWGETQIKQILDDVLPPGSYEQNLRLKDSQEAVEFGLRMPIKGATEPVYLSVDAKFPTADYDRLLQALEVGDTAEAAKARKSLESGIKLEASKIKTKYIVTPKTVEYAVMFLPTEGLFAEVSRIPGLVEEVRRAHNVWIVGPALLPAMLHCIRVGYLTLSLEQNAGKIGETLGAVKSAWTILFKQIELAQKKANGLAKQIGTAKSAAKQVGASLHTVTMIEYQKAQAILGIEPDLADSEELNEFEDDGETEAA